MKLSPAELICRKRDGEALTDEQVVGFCFLLIIAGNETTTKLLANCLFAMQRFPDARRTVIAPRRTERAMVFEIVTTDGTVERIDGADS